MTDVPPHGQPEPIVIRDKRKIDPVTGQVRRDRPSASAAPAAAASAPVTAGDVSEQPAPATGAGELAALRGQLDERTSDLQRVQAEYANYRKRAERDRLVAGDVGVGRALSDLLPILDDLDRAAEHGDLTGVLKAIADKLAQALDKLGLVAFGQVGDAFDPTVHEAVTHGESPEVDRPTCTMIMRKGYRHGERLLRAAMVGVSDPGASDPGANAEVPRDAAPAGDEPRVDDAEPDEASE